MLDVSTMPAFQFVLSGKLFEPSRSLGAVPTPDAAPTDAAGVPPPPPPAPGMLPVGMDGVEVLDPP